MKNLLLALIFALSPVAFAQDEAPAEVVEDAVPADAEAPKADAPADDAEAPADDAEAPEAKKAKVELKPVEVPASDDQAIEDVQEAVNALQTGQWATFVVLLLGLIGFVWNRFAGSKAADTKAEPDAK